MNALNILGLKIEFKEWQKSNQLPFYITDIFLIKKATINGIDCLSLFPQKELPTVSTLKKQIQKIKEIENLPIFIQLDHISNFRKESFLQNNIPFILKNKIVFLPFITTFLDNQTYSEDMTNKKLTLAAQLLFIWILYQDTNKFFISDALETIQISNMTLTRAYRQLSATKLFNEHKDGRKIYLTTELNKINLFNSMKQYLHSPIIKKGYILKSEVNRQMTLANESALSYYSFINQPKTPTYALSKTKSKNLVIQKELVDYDKQVEIQIWAYDPLLFSKNRINIDALSLITSFLDNQDERINIEIEQLLKNTLKMKGD